MKQTFLEMNALERVQQYALLGCTSLLAIASASVSATAQSPTPIPDISVSSPATSAPAEGSEAAGYRPDTVSNVGPLGKMPILDVPYSVNVITHDLIENKIDGSPDSVLRISPVIQEQSPFARSGQSNYNLRGFFDSAFAEDGLRQFSGAPIEAMEDKERVEVYTGLTSFLFGPTNVGGMVNFVYKRPTETPLANVTIGDYGRTSAFAHGDFSGPINIPGIPDGMFAYRLNLVEQHGDLPADTTKEDRQLVSGILSWHVNENTTVEFLGSHYYEDLHAPADFFTASPNTAAGGALFFNYQLVPNPNKNYSAQFTTRPVQVDRGEVTVTSKLNDIFTLRSAFSFANDYFSGNYVSNDTLAAGSNTGIYSTSLTRNNGTDIQYGSYYGLLDAHFFTGPIEHKMTAGYYGDYDTDIAQAGTYNAVPVNNLNFLANPVFIPQPVFTSTQSFNFQPFVITQNSQNNVILGDEIKFNQYLSALVGANWSELITHNHNSTPPYGLSSSFDEAKLTPSLSLIVKPLPWLSTYATYSQGLEPGAVVATGSNFTNGGQALPPFLDNEIEIGSKAQVGGMLLTGALFRINKANQFAQANANGTQTEVQDGREIHDGIELTATGNVMEGLRLLGGITLMDPRVTHTASPTTDNKYPVNVANQMVKSTMEYDLPFLRGLTLTGGVYYVGKAPADALNSAWLPAYVTEDLGFRYRSRIPTGQEVVFRFNVSNLTNKAYWVDNGLVGSPRTIAFSTEVRF